MRSGSSGPASLIEPRGAAPGAAPLDRWDRAAGFAIGAQGDLPPLGLSAEPARAALERAALAGLRRAPCTVSFSGGRDSSAVLAVATRLAHREGLPLPIPVTLRFPEASTAHEARWQELVVAHLGLHDWERIEIHAELDHLGEMARAALLHHGLLWPANTHAHEPLLACAAGGSVLTGIDGDGLLGASWPRLRAQLTRPGIAHWRDVLRAGLAVSPTRVRAARYRRRPQIAMPWLRPDARREIDARFAADRASEPVRWDRRVEWYARRRYLHVGVHNFAILGAEHDTLVCHPLLDRGFLAALAAEGGRGGYGDRSAAMRCLFGDLLPDAVLTRTSKAEFGAAFWGPAAREFAATWDGSGLDEELVDVDALRAVWSEENPPLHTATLMQQAWLAGNAGG